jgi:hypothetical protein
MPYIANARREDFLGFENQAKGLRIDSAGELNYLLTKLMLLYLAQHGENYRIINEIIGALECAKTEFIRRKLIPLEEAKRVENGDVFGVPGATE